MKSKIQNYLHVNWRTLKATQGQNVKSISHESMRKLKSAMIDAGYSVPIIIWQDGDQYRIIDGHHRVQALSELEGKANVPDKIPAILLDCKDESEARKCVMLASSVYAETNATALDNFLKKAMGTSSLAQLPRLVMPKKAIYKREASEKKSKKISMYSDRPLYKQRKCITIAFTKSELEYFTDSIADYREIGGTTDTAFLDVLERWSKIKHKIKGKNNGENRS